MGSPSAPAYLVMRRGSAELGESRRRLRMGAEAFGGAAPGTERPRPRRASRGFPVTVPAGPGPGVSDAARPPRPVPPPPPPLDPRYRPRVFLGDGERLGLRALFSAERDQDLEGERLELQERRCRSGAARRLLPSGPPCLPGDGRPGRAGRAGLAPWPWRGHGDRRTLSWQRVG